MGSMLFRNPQALSSAIVKQFWTLGFLSCVDPLDLVYLDCCFYYSCGGGFWEAFIHSWWRRWTGGTVCQHYCAKTTGHWYCYLQPNCGDTRWQCRYTIHQESKRYLFYFRWRDVYSKTIMYLRTYMCCITFPTPRCTFQITQVCMVPFAVNGQRVGNKRWLIYENEN